MIRVLASILLIISMVALSHVAVKKTAPGIEESLLTKTTAALQEKGLKNISLAIDGRNLSLGGVVTQDEDRRVAGDVAATITGLHSVTNRIQIRRAPANEVAAVRIGANRPAAIRPSKPPATAPRVPMVKPAPSRQPRPASATPKPKPVIRPAPAARPAPAKPPVITAPSRQTIQPKPATRPATPVIKPVVRPVTPAPRIAPAPVARPPAISRPIADSPAPAQPKATMPAQQLQASGITPNPYKFSLRKTGNRVVSSGYLPDSVALTAVRRHVSLRKNLGAKQAPGAPANFAAAAGFAAMAVSKLQSGSATITGREIAIKGSIPGSANDFIDQIEPALPNGFSYSVEVESPTTKKPQAAARQTAPPRKQLPLARVEPKIIQPQTVSKEQLRNEAANCQASIDTTMSGRNIAFDFGKAEINRSSRRLLDEIISVMFACPGAYLAVTGHTDSRGSGERNRIVSQERADAVRKYLVNAGLYANNVAAVGLGASQPIADNGSAEGRARNRRIEFSVSSEPN